LGLQAMVDGEREEPASAPARPRLGGEQQGGGIAAAGNGHGEGTLGVGEKAAVQDVEDRRNRS